MLIFFRVQISPCMWPVWPISWPVGQLSVWTQLNSTRFTFQQKKIRSMHAHVARAACSLVYKIILKDKNCESYAACLCAWPRRPGRSCCPERWRDKSHLLLLHAWIEKIIVEYSQYTRSTTTTKIPEDVANQLRHIITKITQFQLELWGYCQYVSINSKQITA